MRVFEWALMLLIPAWISFYTFSYALYLWKRRFVLGAVSSFILAGLGGLGAVVFFYFQAFGS